MQRTLLAVSAVPPWPIRNGYSLRVANLLEELDGGWKITIISPRYSGSGHSKAPSSIDWIEIPDLPVTTSLPWRSERSRLTFEVQKIVDERQGFGAAILWNGTEFLVESVSRMPWSVADRIDCETLQIWRRLRSVPPPASVLPLVRRGFELLAYERGALRACDHVLAAGNDDAKALRKITGLQHVTAISNGVDLPDLAHLPDEAALPTVVFTGVLAYPPNIQAARFFVEEVWPAIRRRLPEGRFIIAGRNPDRDVLQLEDAPGVTVKADVPDLSHLIRRAWVAVAPMRTGSGVKNKVLEAWAAGRPVVMTQLATNGLHLDQRARDLVASGTRDMQQKIVTLLNNGEQRKLYGQAARRLAEEQHGWGASAQDLNQLLERSMSA